MSRKEMFEKFSKDREEIKSKILEFYEPKPEYEVFRFHTITHLEDELEKDYEFCSKQVNGNPVFSISGSTIQLWNAIYMLLNYDGNFYKNLHGILTLKELEMAEGPWFDLGAQVRLKSREELNVIREMVMKSPEEIEKIKKQLDNE